MTNEDIEKIDKDLEEFDEDEYFDECIEEYYYDDIEKQYIHDIKKYPVLTMEEENKLFKMAKNGNIDARKRIIECNLKYVVHIASKYKNCNLDFMELVQEGNVGLVEALEKFDISYNVKFAFYARYYIEKQIRDIIRRGKNIIIPENIYSSKYKISLYENKILLTENRHPDISEISKVVNIPENLLKNMFRALDTMASLDTFIDEDNSNLIDFITYEENFCVEDYILNKMFYEKVIGKLEECLTKRQLEIIKYKYGIDDGIYKNLQQCEEKFGVTFQRIQYVETLSLKKLSKKLEYLKEEYNEL